MAGSKTILCIEDDHFIGEMYSRALVAAGYQVESAKTGEEGQTMAKSKDYDLILLDIWIPQKNGIEVLQTLRGKDGKGLPDTKIIITTNYAQDEESRAALQSQADGYFIKAEITPRKMVQIVESLIGKPREA